MRICFGRIMSTNHRHTECSKYQACCRVFNVFNWSLHACCTQQSTPLNDVNQRGGRDETLIDRIIFIYFTFSALHVCKSKRMRLPCKMCAWMVYDSCQRDHVLLHCGRNDFMDVNISVTLKRIGILKKSFLLNIIWSVY